jgi:BirA family biotin operon repressor/biotin-[acetyl-CoA-carboxylase] ligase
VTPFRLSAAGIRHYDSIDSTNDEARRLAEAGEKGPLWIVAREQTKGRGRRGRTWVSQAGNLFATLLMPAPRHPGQFAFVAGLAAGEVVAGWAPLASVALKWPNDVLLNGKKVCGILLEGLGRDTFAIGIGINLAGHPMDTEFPATSVKEAMGRAPSPDDAHAMLAGTMSSWYEVWEGGGFAEIREAWLARASHLGQTIRIRLERGESKGVFEGLDEDGALLLRKPDGAVDRIAAGDVFF